ncbi:MAG: flagellar basal body rod protein FlgC [Chloroflexi bacterium]|nr:flagellar basal body rod protein FlgC [Chloroflexota bacterium]
MGLFRAIAATASGLAVQRVRMDVVSGNVANIDSTSTADGQGAYRRHIVRVSSASGGLPFADVARQFTGQADAGVVTGQVSLDTTTPTRQLYQPAHPDADENGYVELPNVDLVTEMTDLTTANRSYQANVTVLNAVKQMALKALDIGSR